jgi:phage terminase large subunit-like protein
VNLIDKQVIDILEVRLDSTYIRFESNNWYKYNPLIDIYSRVVDCEWLENEFQKTKEENQ